MQILLCEENTDYSRYSFPYTIRAVQEPSDRLSDIYNRGFLPDSSSIYPEKTFYMARSTRIDLSLWSMNSENRRVSKKHSDTSFTRAVYRADEFDTSDPDFRTLCLEYIKEIFNLQHSQPEDKLECILSNNQATHIVKYTDDTNTPLAYVLLLQDENMSHFWFSFYDLSLQKSSFGLYLMIQETIRALEANQDFMYLGTAYGAKGRYKCNFDSLEYWNGNSWCTDKAKLKSLLREETN